MAKKRAKRATKKKSSKPSKKKDIWVVEKGKFHEFHDHESHARRLDELHEKHRPHPHFYIGMFIAVLVILGGAWLYVDALGSVELTDVEITEFMILNSTTFHISGNVIMHNPRSIPLRYEAVDYFIFLGTEKVLLAEGFFPGAQLDTKSTTKVPFQKTMHASPTFETVMGLIEDRDDILLIKGTVHLPMTSFAFEKRMSVRDSLKVYLTMKLDDMLGQIDNMEDVPEILTRLENNLREKLAQL